MPSPTRLKRIADRIRQEIAEMLVMGEISDPRLVGVSVTDVNVDREFAYANIFVSAVEGHVRAEEILQGLESARGYLRKQLSARVKLRTFPQLRFHWDPTLERADRIEQLLDTIKMQEVKGKRK